MAISGEPGLEVGKPTGDGKEDATSMATSDKPGPEALREKVLGAVVSGSPIGDEVSGQSSTAAKADGICCDSDKTTTELKSRSNQAAYPVACPFSYPPSDTMLAVAAPIASMAISGEPGLEVGEPSG
jgi:hypothetical protein